ncbi:hypothetical protein E3V93_13225 [Microbacterium sp. 3H14]|uniref:hypothetical protein n=1 Tax=unclassified Microbacterium TaxID=2609290 RepID=UPI00106A1F16|nr:hypothetical protein [Microbacterium sp. 3H14]TFB17516.1 hypothetical protein E3V93_13225 [Microbacterium sp. 3H14]
MGTARSHAPAGIDLRDRLERRTIADPAFWDFADSGARSGGHAYFQYPAMMVPELQGALLDDAVAAAPGIRRVYDPFVGSGTVLLESVYRGLSFHGTDINPMAILLCQVKADPPEAVEAWRATRAVLALATELIPGEIEFFGRDKWFLPAVLRDLLRLRDAIRKQKPRRTRRFLWVCLAETIRLVSNSRTSTVKLHIYAPDVLASRRPDALRTFREVVVANCGHVEKHWERFGTRPTEDGEPDRAAAVTLLQGSVDSRWTAPKLADVLMTSPPYGDNTTTIPYGQHSYLPLQFIDPDDIPGGFDQSLIETTHAIDFRSLGGSLREAEKARADLGAKSPALANYLKHLVSRPDLEKKVLAFVRDYDRGFGSALTNLAPGGFAFLTLGERRVGGHIFPLVQVTQELLEARGQCHIATIERRLSRKRMAVRNSIGTTMATESILVMQSPAPEVDAREARTA